MPRAALAAGAGACTWGVWGVGGGREMRSSEDRSPDALPRKLSIVLDSHPPVSISISRGVRALRLTVSLLYLEHGLAEAEELPTSRYISLYLPSSPFISLHLPSSPFISLHLPNQVRQAAMQRFERSAQARSSNPNP